MSERRERVRERSALHVVWQLERSVMQKREIERRKNHNYHYHFQECKAVTFLSCN